MNNSAKDETQMSYMIIREGSIAEVNDAFLRLSGFSIEDFVGTPFLTVWNELLRINVKPTSLKENIEALLFTKSQEVRFINIEVNDEIDSQIYFLKEKLNSRFEEKFNFLHQHCIENISALSVFSVPEMILLKANQITLDTYNVPYNTPENAFGKPIHLLVSGWQDINEESVFRHIISTGKSRRIKEGKHYNILKEITYWDITITPLKEDGKVKYIVINADDVTERVLSREHIRKQFEIIKQQKEHHKAVIENISDAVYVLDKDGKYFSYNTKGKYLLSSFFNNETKIGERYRAATPYDIDGNVIPIENVPARRIINGERFVGMRIAYKLPDKTINLEISGTPIYDGQGNFIMGILCCHDITALVNSELEISRQKEQLEAVIENMHDAFEIYDKD